MSLPVRGAWIEIPIPLEITRKRGVSLPVRGAWIEIGSRGRLLVAGARRSPCGERGLKFHIGDGGFRIVGVAPRAGSVD